MALIQILLVGCGILLGAVGIAFLSFLISYVAHRAHGGGALIAGCFLAGALAGGIAVWRLALTDWTLPLRITIEAAVNAERYGRPVEHAAEQILTVLIFAATLCGGACAGTAAMAGRMSRKFALTAAVGKRRGTPPTSSSS